MSSRWVYFSEEEVAGLDHELVTMLDIARGRAGVPFEITCGLRTQDHNDALANSVKDSAHITGNAVDIACTDSQARFKMIKALIATGFNRMGIYQNHIHIDNSRALPQNVIWYVEGR